MSAPLLSRYEFIALVAMNFAMVAFSVDAMLPALPEIAAELSPNEPNNAQLVLISFVLGMGLGTFIVGPLSDSFGRKSIIACGLAFYIVGALMAAWAQSLEAMLIGRLVQGLGVAAPRIVIIAIVRDVYGGRTMASILSYAMMVFTLVPAAAPLVGSVIINAFGWRELFYAFVLFAALVTAWLMVRQPETLKIENRQPFKFAVLVKATKECFSHRIFTLSCLVQILTFAILFATLSSTQQIFQDSFGRNDSFPAWFALIALLGGLASIINARLVERQGMRRMISIGLAAQVVISGIVLIIGLIGHLPFGIYLVWAVSLFFMMGLVLGNINALAMEPLSHIAGLAASVLGGVATVAGAIIAVPVGLAFNGTPTPLALSVFLLSVIGLAITYYGLNEKRPV